MIRGNLYKKVPKKLPKELFSKILSKKDIEIIRIVSKRHITPRGKWYNQGKNEFVILLKGNAEISFIKNDKTRKLKMVRGDYVYIPSHLKHRVNKTAKETVWLAVFH